MKNKQSKRLGWIAASLAGLTILIFGVWWIISKIPTLQDQFPQNEISLSLTILKPEEKSEWPADAFIPIQVITAGAAKVNSLELWINGNLVESLKPQEQTGVYLNHTFHWLPENTEKSRIFIRAIAESGETASSNPININISNPTGIRIVSNADSLIEVDEISFPVQSTGGPTPNTTHPLTTGAEPASPPLANSNFSFWMGNRFTNNEEIPTAPLLSYSVDNCTIELAITDQSDNELGYFIYRSLSGSSNFERIANLGNAEKGTDFGFSDSNKSEGVIYYSAAFNGAGESGSTPIFVDLDSATCLTDVKASTLDSLDQEEFQLLNLAYFYYAFNGGGFQRYPASQEVFLTPSEYPTPLSSLVSLLIQDSPYPISTADLVIWGWQGGSLVNLGAQHLLIDDSRLTVCNLGTNCTGDVASSFRSTFGELANDEEDQIREFYWLSTAPGTTNILWQISTSPFPTGFTPQPYGLVGGACLDSSQNGSFLIDFASLESYTPAPSSCGTASPLALENTQFNLTNQFPITFDTRYYIRFTPMAGNQPAGKPSNAVVILAKPGESFIEPIIVDHLPDIYDVEITGFTPAKNSDPQWWGCISIMSLDYNLIWDSFRKTIPSSISDSAIDNAASTLYDELKYVQDNNLLICPTDYVKQDESVLSEWRDMLTEGMESFWSTITSAFEGLKTGIVDAVAAGLNAINIPCDSTCKAALKTGLELAFTYFTGLPPSLPDFDRLVDDGLDYAIEIAAAEAGIPCPDECKILIKKELKAVVDAVAKSKSQPACVNESWAHVLGKNAFCFPPGVETKPYPLGVSTQATAEVKITRTGTGETPAFKYHDQNSYVLAFEITATNDKLVGQTIPYEYQYWPKVNTGYKESFTIYAAPGLLKGHLYQTEYIPIPPLIPEESLTIPISLKNAEYFFLEHLTALAAELGTRGLILDDVGGLGGRRPFIFDWQLLYYGGLLNIEAEIYCLDMQPGLIGSTQPGDDSTLVPCGSSAAPYLYQQPDEPYYP